MTSQPQVMDGDDATEPSSRVHFKIGTVVKIEAIPGPSPGHQPSRRLDPTHPLVQRPAIESTRPQGTRPEIPEVIDLLLHSQQGLQEMMGVPADAAFITHDRSRIDPDTHQAKNASVQSASPARRPFTPRASRSSAPRPWHISRMYGAPRTSPRPGHARRPDNP